MQRRPTTQDITWLVDLDRNKQLDLEPPYQRRSVWTRKDKRFFLDTIFRNYPSPAIFLHKTLDDAGKPTYHVVDGKQRTQTILEFFHDEISLSPDFGDSRVDGKRWSELQGDAELKQRFWNYQITVEMIDFGEEGIINEVFDRLNRNARKLTRQELRHAKFDGWLIKQVEVESEREEWRKLGVVTAARAKRMTDSQFISELLLVLLEKKEMGFDQDGLDDLYAKYDEPEETASEFNEEEFQDRLASVKAYLIAMNESENTITRFAKGLGNIYTLWCVVALRADLPPAPEMAARYREFMGKVETLGAQQDVAAFLQGPGNAQQYAQPLMYFNNARGANTDLRPRHERFVALASATLA